MSPKTTDLIIRKTSSGRANVLIPDGYLQLAGYKAGDRIIWSPGKEEDRKILKLIKIDGGEKYGD